MGIQILPKNVESLRSCGCGASNPECPECDGYGYYCDPDVPVVSWSMSSHERFLVSMGIVGEVSHGEIPSHLIPDIARIVEDGGLPPDLSGWRETVLRLLHFCEALGLSAEWS